MSPSQEEPVQTIAEESRSEGNIGASLYFKYLNAGASILVMLGTVLLSLIAEVLTHPKCQAVNSHMSPFYLIASTVNTSILTSDRCVQNLTLNRSVHWN